MQEFDPVAHFGLFLNRDFLDAETCANLLVEVNSSPTTQAPVYIEGTEGTIHEDIRKTTSLHPSDETISEMWNRLFQQKPLLEDHFGESLTDCERPQFLRYQRGRLLCSTPGRQHETARLRSPASSPNLDRRFLEQLFSGAKSKLL